MGHSGPPGGTARGAGWPGRSPPHPQLPYLGCAGSPGVLGWASSRGQSHEAATAGAVWTVRFSLPAFWATTLKPTGFGPQTPTAWTPAAGHPAFAPGACWFAETHVLGSWRQFGAWAAGLCWCIQFGGVDQSGSMLRPGPAECGGAVGAHLPAGAGRCCAGVLGRGVGSCSLWLSPARWQPCALPRGARFPPRGPHCVLWCL